MTAVSISLITDVDIIMETVNCPFVKSSAFEDGVEPKRRNVEQFLDDPENNFFYGIYSPWYRGFFMFHRRGKVSWDCHACMLKRGDPSASLGFSMAIKEVFKNTPCVKLYAEIPCHLEHARQFALNLGFKQEGTMEQTFQHNGTIIDQWLLGLKKGELICP